MGRDSSSVGGSGSVYSGTPPRSTLPNDRRWCESDFKMFEVWNSDAGLVAAAEGCKLLRELRTIDGRKRIGEKGLVATAKCCNNLQEVVLIGMLITKATFEMFPYSCQRAIGFHSNTDLLKLFEYDVSRMWLDLGVYCWIKGILYPRSELISWYFFMWTGIST